MKKVVINFTESDIEEMSEKIRNGDKLVFNWIITTNDGENIDAEITVGEDF